MKNPIIVVISISVALAIFQWFSSSEGVERNQILIDNSSLISVSDEKKSPQSLSKSPAKPIVSKENQVLTRSVDFDAEANDSITGSIDFRQATLEFEALDSNAQLERRKVALSKVISGAEVDIADEIALQQDWEREGRAEPGFQHKIENAKIDVNGTVIDVAQSGVVVADRVMVYIPKGQSSLIAELGSVAGITNIQPLFKNAKPSNTSGTRDLSGWQEIELNAPVARIRSVVKALESFDGLQIAEPVFERRINADPLPIADLNDALMSDQWHLDAANVKAAWGYLENNNLPAGGNASITVAVVDSGVDYTHPDLVDNMWVNAQEVPDNGVDDDGNGFVDDIHGASVVSESYSHTGDPDDDHGHGTHVAGIIASTGGNSVGGVGIAYNTKIMAVKSAQYSGVLTSADIAEGIYYAVDNGADIINMSFGGYGRSQVEEDALANAYSQAVLIAAAGNNGKPNQVCGRVPGAPIYPASYPWVLGVMARAETPDAGGGYKAGFSNYDCVKNNGLEYEVIAPGAEIWSTLPDGSYSAWSGTSMAAPVVAGIAALARTRWPDKSAYNSGFIMGQVGATGDSLQSHTPSGGAPVSYAQVNALNALTATPKPELTYEQHWLFDDADQGSSNDGDGRVDAGETVELAIMVRNRWGKADNMVATLSTPSGNSTGDPYVSFQTATVNYGSVGSFNKDDNGLEYDEGLLVTGVSNPFVFSVAEDTPNNHIIPITLTMTASNGLDPDDTTTYSFESTFDFVVQRGRELPSIIDSDAAGTDGGNIDTDGIEDGIVTLDSSALWIVDKPVLIYNGTTLKVTEGAEIQFWSSQPDEAYTIWRPSYIQVEGTLDIEGVANNPVHLFPSDLFPSRAVHIFAKTTDANIHMSYAKVTNLVASDGYGDPVAWNSIDYSDFSRALPGEYINGGDTTAVSPSDLRTNYTLKIPEATNSSVGNRFSKLGFQYKYFSNTDGINSYYLFSIPANQSMALVDSASFSLKDGAQNSVFLKNRNSFVNRYGDRVKRGSLLENLSSEVDYTVVEPFSYEGKTYAIFYEQNGTVKSAIASAQAYARSLGGTLMTVSSDAEIVAVNNWLIDLNLQTNDYWKEKYSLCESASSEDTFCKSTLGSDIYGIGLLRQSDGSYLWDGDDEGYGDDFLLSQRYWDRAQFAINNGSAPTADELDWEVVVSALVMDANRHLDEGNGDFYKSIMVSYAVSYANASRFIIELPGELSQADLDAGLTSFKQSKESTSFFNNAILNVWHDLNPMHWGTVAASDGDTSRRWDLEMDIRGNFWGGANDALVEIAITDFSDNFNKARVNYQPTLSNASETTYPFVVKAEVLDADGIKVSGDRFGAQESKWRVTFNRDMDTTKQPLVTFGPAEPFTNFSVPGDWLDARTWQGSFTFNALSGDGWQNIRVVGAVAADNPWLVTGDDSERFRFELITSGTEALALQASGQAGKVSLSWVQDDFEILQGYNLYRSTSENGTYSRVNSSTINKSVSAYTDTDVAGGVPHYYYFTVVSDDGESDPSNIAMAIPTDTTPPVVTHNPESVVSLASSLTLRATVTDNIAVTAVDIVFRNASSTEWQTRTMAKTGASRYSITIEPSAIGGQYLEYYIEGKDSANSAFSGSVDSPYKVYISLPSDTDTDGDNVNNAQDAFPYDPTETSDFDGDGIGDNSDTDDDGDGRQDTEDTFPLDASEWEDSDGDGSGNNADFDDDNDGVNDNQDLFPLDNRGALDSDADGMPDQWEIDNGLNPNDRTDSSSDLDNDGYTARQEFEAKTSPMVPAEKTQMVFYEAGPFIAGQTNTMSVHYRSRDGVTDLNGLGLRVHFNSQLIDSITLSDLLLIDLVNADSVAIDDINDFDNDESTDSYLAISWFAPSGTSWSGSMPVKLFDLEIDFSSQLTVEDMVNIRFSSSSTHPGYGFSGTPLETTVNINTLDIDGNGVTDALSDGLLIMRGMFGFAGDILIKNAVALDAKYSSASEIEARLNKLGLLLDIDGNGRVSSLTDGLLIQRYLFGLRGEVLTDNVVALDATRTSAQEIEAYLAKIAPNI